MGLDIFEISHRIEKVFNLDFDPDEFGKVYRKRDFIVGDLYALILEKLNLCDLTQNDIGLNYHVWFEIQETLHAVTGVSREDIELQTPLESLFPKPTRRKAWNAFRAACSYRIRELDYPRAVLTVGFLLAFGVGTLELFQIGQIPFVRWFRPLLGFASILLISETYLKILTLCAPFRTSLPSGMVTVKDLCRTVLGANYREVCEQAEIAYDQRCLAVWEQLVAILVDILRVEPADVAFHSRLRQDLGMD